MFALLPFLCFLSLVQSVYTALTECGRACQSILSEIEFEGTDPAAGYYVTQCTTTLVVQSAFLCMKHYCTENELAAGLQYFNQSCEKYVSVPLLPWSVIRNISDEEYVEFSHIQYENLSSSSATYNTPVFIDQSLYDLSYRTMVREQSTVVHLFLRQNKLIALSRLTGMTLLRLVHVMGMYSNLTLQDMSDQPESPRYALYWFFAGVVAISLTLRAIGFVLRCWQGSEFKSTSTVFGKTLKITYKKMLFSPLMPQSTWGRVPPQIDSIAIIAFIILNVILCCANYKVFDRNL